MTLLIAAMLLFVGSHFLLSHTWRAPLVHCLGERGFRALFSGVALVTLVAAVMAYRAVGPGDEVRLWTSGVGLWHGAAIPLLAATILFAGSFSPSNRAMTELAERQAPPPSGVVRITRHPMMWAIALWALFHIAMSGRLSFLILGGGLALLALAGAAAQDAKKRRLEGPGWAEFERRTSFWPLGAQLAGRQPWSSLWPGWPPVLGGLALWLLLTWLHPSLMGAPAVGVWDWLQR